MANPIKTIVKVDALDQGNFTAAQANTSACPLARAASDQRGRLWRDPDDSDSADSLADIAERIEGTCRHVLLNRFWFWFGAQPGSLAANMAVRLIRGDDPLPEPEQSDSRGLLAIGGDLRPERLLDAYRRGIFPWYAEGLPILWHSPDPRFVLIPSDLRVNRSLAKSVRRDRYRITLDTAFAEVVRNCAAIAREGQDGTWITLEMIAAYEHLHALGRAHSVEAWLADELVGGLYGVAVGGLFCGESMFSFEPDASKVAFVRLVRQLERWGFEAIDCQVHTDHLERFGALEWPRKQFLRTLADLRDLRVGPPGPWRFDDESA